MVEDNKKGVFEIGILAIQPTQLYISKDKLKAVKGWLGRGEVYDPIPIKRIRNVLIFVDGHTRALALYQLGHKTLKVEWEMEDWNWPAYEVCMDWCRDAQIGSIADLSERLLDRQAYELLWHERCKQMHEDLDMLK